MLISFAFRFIISETIVLEEMASLVSAFILVSPLDIKSASLFVMEFAFRFILLAIKAALLYIFPPASIEILFLASISELGL